MTATCRHASGVGPRRPFRVQPRSHSDRRFVPWPRDRAAKEGATLHNKGDQCIPLGDRYYGLAYAFGRTLLSNLDNEGEDYQQER